MDNRNAYMLKGRLAKRGYDWWWHSLVGINRVTGEKQPFFIEYFVINPALGNDQPIFGQLPENQKKGIKPSYAMLKAGAWKPGKAVQIHNFYPIQDFSVTSTPLAVRIGNHTLSEHHLTGSVKLSAQEAANHPEYMSESGEMSWDLKAEKPLAFNVGFGASPLFRALNAFEMFWHAQGMLTRYTGTIIFNGETFDVTPETCAGYQDKNWGSDYTDLWIWLNCNNFTSRSTGKKLALTSLDVGGAEPVLWGMALPRRLLIAFYHEGNLYEYNFSKIWTKPHQATNCVIEPDKVIWDLNAQNNKSRIKINFVCPRSHMHRFNYENPDGQKRHRNLWNGGWASGTVELYEKVNGKEVLVDIFDGDMGGCEYGEADKKN
jgi:hypothetical protein